MTEFVSNYESNVKRTRRRHQKSRNGCSECKRRRVKVSNYMTIRLQTNIIIKCDETKSSCERCVLLQNKCVYPTAPQSIASNGKDESYQQSSLGVALPPSLDSSSCSEHSPSFATSAYSPLGSVDYCSNSMAETLEPISDVILYHHYMQHTSRTLTPGQQDQIALQIQMPELALENQTVLYSMLAVSAACMCCDMIEKEPETSTSAVIQILMAGYWHYNLASKQMRESISRPDTLKPDHLLASAVLLVPFATASQQINHWISTRSRRKVSTKLLSVTPRDAIILMRGIRTTLQTLCCSNFISSLELATEPAGPAYSPSVESNISSALPPLPTHVMFAIVATTSQSAFSTLQERLDCASFHQNEGGGDSLSACKAAFKILDFLRTRAFSTTEESFESAPVPLPQMPTWLHSFARRAANPQPDETLTSFFLGFLVQTPQAYLDLVLPLLDQRLENPIGESSKVSSLVGLTMVQVLALDIYAHWSVLMFLVEDYSWWIGSLPEVTLTGMVNAYGDDFVRKLVPESSSEKWKWWPGGMLNILREVKGFR
jgi:hypothetical protein